MQYMAIRDVRVSGEKHWFEDYFILRLRYFEKFKEDKINLNFVVPKAVPLYIMIQLMQRSLELSDTVINDTELDPPNEFARKSSEMCEILVKMQMKEFTVQSLGYTKPKDLKKLCDIVVRTKNRTNEMFKQMMDKSGSMQQMIQMDPVMIMATENCFTLLRQLQHQTDVVINQVFKHNNFSDNDVIRFVRMHKLDE